MHQQRRNQETKQRLRHPMIRPMQLSPRRRSAKTAAEPDLDPSTETTATEATATNETESVAKPAPPRKWSQPITTGSGSFFQRFTGWEPINGGSAAQDEGDYVTHDQGYLFFHSTERNGNGSNA